MRARELRALLKLRQTTILDPFDLAPKVGLTLMDIADVPVDGAVLQHLLDGASDQWSGGVYAKPLPDGTYLCILNPTHDIRRRRITLMEEIAHIFLEHAPSGVRDVGGISVRDYDSGQEQEAYGVGAAALLPWPAFFSDLNNRSTIEQIARKYAVSTALIEYRISITGASNLYKARQRSRIRRRTFS